MREIALSPFAAGLLEPHAVIIEPPARPGDRRQYGEWILPRAGSALQFHINRVAPATLPLRLDRVERHPHAAQVFLPLDVGRYLVTVMPAGAAGTPDPAGAVSVILPGHLGLIYRPGAWHAGVTVLDREGAFAVLMQRGAPDDDVFAAIDPCLLTLPVPAEARP